MTAIVNAIPPQNFELIRDKIAEILYLEIENQWILTYDNDLRLAVWVERTIPFDHTEMPAINVSLASGSYDNDSPKSSDGTYLYNIDVFTKSAKVGTTNGDQLAAIKMQRLLGVCRAIMRNNAYFVLGFAQPSLSNTKVTSLLINDASNHKDAEHVMMGRMVFSVRVPETVELKVANLIEGSDTAVKMSLTDKGYVFTGDQPEIPPDTCSPVTITINGIAYAVVASGETIDIPIEYESGSEVPITLDYETVIVPDPGGSADWVELWP